ncbi:MAG TPA: diaminopimelate epimerase [Telluria sp.]|nr:diaminopimelate epimerase [Telluria sp.]
MKLKFTKMHGAGNDFIVVDAINQQVDFTREQWAQLAHRQLGIGSDQILVVEKPTVEGCDFRYRIFNNDGGEVEQCGNGSRAFVRFVVDKGLTQQRSIRVQTMKGIIVPRLEDDGNVTVDMAAPVLEPEAVPFDTTGLSPMQQGRDLLWPLDLFCDGGRRVLLSVLSMGNPHAVQVVDNVDAAPVAACGPEIEGHVRFPQKVNVGFMEVVDRHHIRVRVYERAAGETLACGTGACAAVVAGIRRGLLDSPVRVDARGGVLSIAWDGEGSPVLMTGPAVTVFEGEIEV